MATISRLNFADVRAIFDCLHDDKDIPKHLKFSIVPVGPTRNKLSPPSYEFEGKPHLFYDSDDHFLSGIVDLCYGVCYTSRTFILFIRKTVLVVNAGRICRNPQTLLPTCSVMLNTSTG